MGNQCPYYELALDQCAELGKSADNYIKYLPAVQQGATEPSTPPSTKHDTKDFTMSPQDVMAVLRDNAECRRIMTDQQSQLDEISGQISRLSLLIAMDKDKGQIQSTDLGRSCHVTSKNR